MAIFSSLVQGVNIVYKYMGYIRIEENMLVNTTERDVYMANNENNWIELLSGKNQLAAIIKMNDKTGAFGLTLSENDAS